MGQLRVNEETKNEKKKDKKVDEVKREQVFRHLISKCLGSLGQSTNRKHLNCKTILWSPIILSSSINTEKRKNAVDETIN